MKDPRLRGLLWALLPAVLGFLGSGLTRLGVLTNLVFVGGYHADLEALWLTAGVGISLILVGAWGIQRRTKNRLRRALEEARERQDEDRRRFLRRLDHELKNPLTTIRLGIANLQGKSRLEADEVRSLERIAHQIQRLHGLVEDLRRLAELDEAHLDRGPANLSEILEEALVLVRGTTEWAARAVEVKLQEVPWPVAKVWGDRDLLILAFRNLVENALKFTAASGQVEIRGVDDGKYAVVEVADTGQGIASEELPHIFDELFRGRNAQGLPGSGLGLALVDRIISLHGGRIDVRTRVGKGSVFRVSLPLADA